MTSERYEAYKRALEQIERLAPTKLHDDEEALLRDAAEGLLLSADPASEEATELRSKAFGLLDNLVESGRWFEATSERLRRDLEAACPEPVAA